MFDESSTPTSMEDSSSARWHLLPPPFTNPADATPPSALASPCAVASSKGKGVGSRVGGKYGGDQKDGRDGIPSTWTTPLVITISDSIEEALPLSSASLSQPATAAASQDLTIARPIKEHVSANKKRPSDSTTDDHHHHRPRHGPHDDDTFEKTCFADIVGHGAVKLRMDEILLPMALPSSLATSVLHGIRALPTSILLYGPPGCGKTQLARAMAGEARAAFYSITPSHIWSKFVGESEGALRDVFLRARSHAQTLPSQCAVVFLDEIDALGQSRSQLGAGEGEGCSRRVLAELLLQLNELLLTDDPPHHVSNEVSEQDEPEDALGGDASHDQAENDEGKRGRPRVIVVAATNRPEDCDEALLRRFGIRLHVGLPSRRDRRRMLARHLRGIDHAVSPDDLNELVEASDGWSGSDLESLAREAVMTPVRECLRAAALARRQATQSRRQQQSGGDVSGQGDAPNMPNPDELARRCLLSGFQNLRPVTLADFEKAVNFLMGHQQTASPQHAAGRRAKSSDGLSHFDHYDSSSDDEISM